MLLLPKLTDAREVLVPEVADLSLKEAEKLLSKNKLKVNATIRQIANENIKEGNIVKSDPASGRTVKEGTTIILYQSTGAGTYEMEDFVGKNYIEAKTILEKLKNLFVIITEEEVDDITKFNAGEIIRQEPDAGTMLAPGDNVTLIIPDFSASYPDFTLGDYSLTDITAFAEKYNLNLKVEYKETSSFEMGTIISQTPKAGTTIISGMSLKIVIAEEEASEGFVE